MVEIAGDAHAEPDIAFIQYTGDYIPDSPVLAAFTGNHAFPPHLLDVIRKRLSNLITEKVLHFIQHIRADNILVYFVRIHFAVITVKVTRSFYPLP